MIFFLFYFSFSMLVKYARESILHIMGLDHELLELILNNIFILYITFHDGRNMTPLNNYSTDWEVLAL